MGTEIDFSGILMFGVPNSESRHPESGQRMCFTPFKMSHTASFLRMSPLVATGVSQVFFDATAARIFFKMRGSSSPIPTLAGIEAPVVPAFSDFCMRNLTDREAELHFPAHSELERGIPLYVLQTTRPVVDGERRVYVFTVLGNTQPAPVVKIKGLFKVKGNGELRINPDNSVSLPLIRVSESTPGRKYRISVEQTHLQISIIVSPMNADDQTAPIVPPSIEALFARMIELGPSSGN
jgi:hypothetical protein